MGKFLRATNSLSIPIFTDELIAIIWPEKKRNLECIHETLLQRYTATGSYTKGEVKLSVF